MKRTLRLKKIVLAMGLAVSLLPGTASAFYFVQDTPVLTVLTTMSTGLAAFYGSVLEVLFAIKNTTDSSAMKVADVVNRSSDNQVQRAAEQETAQQNTRIDNALSPPIDPCANASAGFADPTSRMFHPGAGFGGNIMSNLYSGQPGKHNTGSKSLNRAIDIADGNKPAPSPEVQAMLAQQGACQVYATGLRAAACSAAGMTPTAVIYPNGDINASSLFDGAQIKGKEERISMTFNVEQISAAQAYLRNLNNPILPRELTDSEAKTDAGRQYLGLRDAYISKHSMAARASGELVSQNSPNPNNVEIIKAMIEGTGAAAKYIVAYIAAYAADGKTWKDGISNNAMLDIEASRRSHNPAWLTELATASDPLTLQREQLAVSAHTNYLLTKILLSQEKQRVTLGAIHQATTDKEFMPDLLAAHKKATGSVR